MQGAASIYADTVEAKGIRDSLYADAKVCRRSRSGCCTAWRHVAHWCCAVKPGVRSATEQHSRRQMCSVLRHP